MQSWAIWAEVEAEALRHSAANHLTSIGLILVSMRVYVRT